MMRHFSHWHKIECAKIRPKLQLQADKTLLVQAGHLEVNALNFRAVFKHPLGFRAAQHHEVSITLRERTILELCPPLRIVEKE